MKHLDITVIGDEELVNALRLTGISRHYTIKGNHDAAENVRKALTELLAEPDIGIVIILEDYAQYVEDLTTRIRKQKSTLPVIVEVPSKFGTKHPDVKVHYRALIREAIGFEVEV
ncbi:MAG: V-type ATP synthase subunit F [Dehalococcoidia bacterium]|nr:V-type ATP synthase subunit F [Dehalococcoidia bacterium]MDH4299133.1 V-type ATP synthase subunit F [Dehalococcoidia bacterium]MDH4367480.1 V-type ATP synthase subunit F [Dehalococcoidia bacterium]